MRSDGRRLRRAVMLCVGLSCAAARPALAFKLETHVWIGQQVLNELCGDPDPLKRGRVTIPPFGEFRVDDAVWQSLCQYPSQYRMGAIGPDGFPDLVAGQMTTHPGAEDGFKTDQWLAHVLASAPRIPSDRTAFAYGYLTHAAGDMFAHTYVNLYAGDIFDISDQSPPVPDSAEFRHIVLEQYIRDHNPPLLDANGRPVGAYQDIVAVNADFVRDVLIQNPVAAEEYRRVPQTRYLSTMYDFWKKLDDIIASIDGGLASINGEIAKIQGDIDGLIRRINDLTDDQICVNLCLVGCRHCYQIYPASCLFEPSHCVLIESLKLTLEATRDSLTVPMEANELAAEQIKAPFVAWRSDVENAMRQYILTSAAVVQEILKGPNATPPGDPVAPLRAWMCSYAPVFAAVPSLLTLPGCTTAEFVNEHLQQAKAGIDKLKEKLGPLQWALDPMGAASAKIKDELEAQFRTLVPDLVESITGDNSAMVSLVNMRFHPPRTLNEEFTRDTANKGLLSIADIDARADADMHLVERHFDAAQFAPVHNAIVLSKLLLLPADELNRLVRLAGVTQTVYGRELYRPGGNVLINAVRSIDGNHQWQEFAPAYPRSPAQTDPGAQYGYANDGLHGFRLWQDCEVREKVFKRIFLGPIAPAIEPLLAENDPNRTTPTEPFPLAPGSRLEFKVSLPSSSRLTAESASELVVALPGATCGGDLVEPLTHRWSFASPCTLDCTCRSDWFSRYSECECVSPECGISKTVRVDGHVTRYHTTELLHELGTPVGDGLEFFGTLVCDTRQPTAHTVMLPESTRMLALDVTDAAGTSASSSILLHVDAPALSYADWREVDRAVSDQNGGTGACGITPTIVAAPELPPDEEPPTITAPVDLTAECAAEGAGGQQVDLGEPAVADDRDAALDVTNDAPELFGLGTTAVVWTATDDAGNAAADRQQVTIVDTAPPAFAGPLADVTQIATSAEGTPVTLTAPVAMDACRGPVTATTTADLSSLSIGDHRITWAAQDAAGNTSRALQLVHVKRLRGDLDVDGDVDRHDLDLLLGDLGERAVAEPVLRDFDGDGDIDDLDRSVFALIGSGEGDPRDLDRNGTITIADARILVSLCTVTCNVAPTADPGPDRVLECAAPTGTPTSLDASASSDLNADPLTFTWRGPFPEGAGIVHGSPVSVTLGLGASPITLVANDRFADSPPAAVTITVKDTTAPALTVPPDLVIACSEVHADGGGGSTQTAAVTSWLAAATVADACDSRPVLTNDAPAGFPMGNTTVQFTARDASANHATASSHVQVVYAFGGFQKPLLPDGSAVVRQSNTGRTIPIKFRLTCGGADVSAASATLRVFKLVDAATGTVDVTEFAQDAGAANDHGDRFRYDSTDRQYVYNLSTVGLAAPATYRIVVTLDDGTRQTVQFSLR